jgi:hypothetical protein
MFGNKAHAQAQKVVREGGKRMPEQLADWPAGKKGWGARGDLDLGLIEGLTKGKA